MAGIAESLRWDLSAPNGEFAEGYAESFLNTYIAAQIKIIRQQRELTQGQLAGLLGTTQTVISRIENVNYAGWNIGTLKKLARAFDVRLKVSFEEYGTLPEEIERFSKKSLMRARRTDDPRLKDAAEREATRRITATVIQNEIQAITSVAIDALRPAQRLEEQIAIAAAKAIPAVAIEPPGMQVLLRSINEAQAMFTRTVIEANAVKVQNIGSLGQYVLARYGASESITINHLMRNIKPLQETAALVDVPSQNFIAEFRHDHLGTISNSLAQVLPGVIPIDRNVRKDSRIPGKRAEKIQRHSRSRGIRKRA